jgi:hypothetical protein
MCSHATPMSRPNAGTCGKLLGTQHCQNGRDVPTRGEGAMPSEGDSQALAADEQERLVRFCDRLQRDLEERYPTRASGSRTSDSDTGWTKAERRSSTRVGRPSDAACGAAGAPVRTTKKRPGNACWGSC